MRPYDKTRMEAEHPMVLIVDDELKMCKSLGEILLNKGFSNSYCTNSLDAMEKIRTLQPKILILDIRMPGKGGVDILQEARSLSPHIPVLMITGYPSIEVTVQAMKYGATNLFVKPLDIEKIVWEISHLLDEQKKQMSAQNNIKTSKHPVLSRNKEVLEILHSLDKVAKTDASVLITGESGSGKELIAQSIQEKSNRSMAPFIKVNCAALAQTLLESELFGHEKGAFTGAISQHKGKFELAHGGTLFLDEIGDMSLATQGKILRVLQDNELTRLGGEKPIRTNIRLITATNKNIEHMIAREEFREDLYYRIAVVTYSLPPLRERKEDILLLAEYFMNLFAERYTKNLHGISTEVQEILYSHSWPGNIRELKNCIERAVIFSESDVIIPSDLPRQYQRKVEKSLRDNYETAQASLDRDIILEALKLNEGIKQKAAESLRMHRKTLYNKMKKLGIE
jgi:two-component system, NtrC family, response regulator AtoC